MMMEAAATTKVNDANSDKLSFTKKVSKHANHPENRKIIKDNQRECVYCTLVMTDSYLLGALVLACSLRDAGTKKRLAVMITKDTLSPLTITRLSKLYDFIIPVSLLANPNPKNLRLLQRNDLLNAFTKIHVWSLIQFSKIVFIDADVVACKAPDELFNIPASFAAAPDIGWPDIFNSGVMLLTPDLQVYHELSQMAYQGLSFDGADQGLLNQYFEWKNWFRLKFTYNCTPNAEYQYAPAFHYFKDNISLVHYIGQNKPWYLIDSSSMSNHQLFPSLSPLPHPHKLHDGLYSLWWKVYHRHSAELLNLTSPLPITSELTNYNHQLLGFNAHPQDSTYHSLPHPEIIFPWQGIPKISSPFEHTTDSP